MEQQYTYTDNQTYSADSEDLRGIRLTLDAAELTAAPAPDGKVTLTILGGRNCRLSAYVHEHVLQATVLRPEPHWLHQSRVSLLLQLPRSFSGSLDVDLSAGTCAVRGTNLSSLNCEVRAGRLEITGCQIAGKLLAQLKSGTLELANVEADRMELGTISGSIRCEHTVCSTLISATKSGSQHLGVHAGSSCELRTISGNIHFQGSTPLLQAETTSGTQHMQADLLEEAKLRVRSGSVELTVPDGPALRSIDVDVTSGRATLNLPPEVTPVLSVSTLAGACSCRSDAFARSGPLVGIQARMKAGRLKVEPAAAGA